MQAGLGASPAFRVPEYQLQSTFELPLVLVLGALCGFVAAAFRVSTQVNPHPSYPSLVPESCCTKQVDSTLQHTDGSRVCACLMALCHAGADQ